MSDNATLTNKKTSFDADTNSDIPVRSSETASGKQIQHVRLDLGSGSSESVASGTVPVSSAVAHDGADSGNPVKVGFRARTSSITAVSNDDRSDGICDTFGRQVTQPYALEEDSWTAVSASDITNTASTAVKTAGGAGVCYRLCGITVSNMSASVATRVDILDGSTVIWSGPASAGGGGYSKEFKRPKKLTANTAINAQCGTTGAQVRVALDGYSGT